VKKKTAEESSEKKTKFVENLKNPDKIDSEEIKTETDPQKAEDNLEKNSEAKILEENYLFEDVSKTKKHETLFKISLDKVNKKYEELDFKIKKDVFSKFYRLSECNHSGFKEFNELKEIKIIEKEKIKCEAEDCNIENENIWICLSCSQIFCGRNSYIYEGKEHMEAHFNETKKNNDTHYLTYNPFHGMIYCYECDTRCFIPRISEYLSKIGLEFIDYEKKEYKRRKIDYAIENVYSDVQKSDCKSYGLLQNYKNTCYAASVLQLLCRIFPDYILSRHMSICSSNVMDCIVCQFSKTVISMKQNMVCDISGILNIFMFRTKSFIEYEQEDATEFLSILLDYLEEFKEFKDFIKENIVMKAVTHKKCPDCDKESISTCKLYSLMLPFSEELNEKSFTTKNLSFCSNCKKDSLVENFEITEFPKFLLVEVKRYVFDRNFGITKLETPIKVLNELKFKDSKNNEFLKKLDSTVIHFGEARSGHYIFSDRKHIVSDDIVYDCKEEMIENGYIFLFK